MAAPQRPQSPYIPVKVESCVIADSLLGPLTNDHAIVRGYYLPEMDSTRLVAGPEQGATVYVGESRPSMTVSTSYGGRKPSTYPHADVSILMLGHDAARLGSAGGLAPVVLTIDRSPFQLDSIPIKPSPSPVGQSAFITFQVPPNLFFALANAKQAGFLIGRVRTAFSNHELRDISGLYRAGLCGISAS